MEEVMDDDDCRNCKGTGVRLARLTPEQDLAFMKRGQPIPKVDCWVCHGTGIAPQPSAAGQAT